jgi:predicted phosphodiesterase
MNELQLAKWSEEQRQLFEFMGLQYPYNRPPSRWSEYPTAGKILTLADPHRPYHNQIVFDHVEAYEKDAETVVIAGDLGDYYSKSRFRKTRHQKFCDELYSVFKGLEFLATHWRTVKVMIGNHDDRPEKYLYKKLDDSTDILIMTEQNMLRELAANFDNIEIVGIQLDKTDINLSHIYQMGDLIFTHGEVSLAQNSALLDRVQKYLSEWGHVLQLKPFNVIAQAHNHRGTKEEGEPTRFLLPTCCNPYSTGMEYIYAARMIGKPPVIGYSVFYQENGLTDTNRSMNFKFRVRNGKTEPMYRTVDGGDEEGY